MTQAAMETLPSARDYQEAGFQAEQAEILGRSMTRIDAINSRISDELAQLRMFAEDNMPTRKDIAQLVSKDDLRDMLKEFVTKDDLRHMLKDFVTKDDIKDFVTSSQMALEFKQLYRLMFVGMMGICGLILALVPIMLALHLAG